MGTSQKSFDQVKQILGKLGRNIDQVREQRLGVTPAAIGPSLGLSGVGSGGGGSAGGGSIPAAPRFNGQPNAAPNAQVFSKAVGNGTYGPAPTQPAPAPNPANSKYGRAQPIRD